MGLFYALTGAILAFAVVMAFALLFNTMTVNVLERQRELATMRAVGKGRRKDDRFIALGREDVILWLLVDDSGVGGGMVGGAADGKRVPI